MTILSKRDYFLWLLVLVLEGMFIYCSMMVCSFYPMLLNLYLVNFLLLDGELVYFVDSLLKVSLNLIIQLERREVDDHQYQVLCKL